VYQIFVIYLPLPRGRPEVLQGCALQCPGATHAGLSMHSHFKTPQRPENFLCLGFGRERCTQALWEGLQQVHCSGARQLRRDLRPGPMRGGPAATLFRGPAATEGPDTEGTLECLLLAN